MHCSRMRYPVQCKGQAETRHVTMINCDGEIITRAEASLLTLIFSLIVHFIGWKRVEETLTVTDQAVMRASRMKTRIGYHIERR